MEIIFTLPYLLLLGSTLFCVGVGIFSFLKWTTPGAWLLGLLMLQTAGYSIPFMFQVASRDMDQALFWYKIAMLGLCAIPQTWFAFSLHYTGQAHKLTPWRTAALLFIPVVTILLVFTNDWHGLFASNYRQVDLGPFRMLYFTYHLYWVDVIFTYVLVVAGAVILLWSSRNKSGFYQAQAVWLVIGVTPPLITSFLYQLNIIQSNFTPFSFWLTGVFWAIAILYYGFLDMLPLARGMIFDRMNAGVLVVDQNHRILDINPAAYRLLQLPDIPLIGKEFKFLQALQPALDDPVNAPDQVVREMRIPKFSGRHFVELSSRQVFGIKNELVGRLVLLTDVTERRRAEQLQDALYRVSELAHSTANLKEFYASVHAIIARLIPALNFFIALHNPQSDTITFPYSVDEFDDMPEEEVSMEGVTGYVIRSGKALHYTPQRDQDLILEGGFRVIGAVCEDWIGVPLRTAEGRVIGALAAQTYKPGERYSESDQEMLGFVSTQVAMAIERRSAEEKLRESEVRFRTLVENQGEGINIMSPDDIFLFANPAAHDIFGLPQGGLIGRDIAEFVDPVQLEYIRQQTERRKQGEKGSYELEIIRPDGSRRSLLITATPDLGADGSFIGSFGIFRDITELKQARQKLEYISSHDALTDLYNRNYLEDHIQRIQETGMTPVSVLVADLDNLKVINDSRGHAAGDEILRRTAAIFKTTFRPGDLVARFGGDEFVVLLPGLKASQCPVIVDRVRTRIALYNVESPEYPIHISMGIATFNSGDRFETIVKLADEQMYVEKQAKKLPA